MRKFNLNRVGKYARYAYFAVASAMLLAIPCLFGLVQIVMAGFSHDSTKRIIGVTCIIGGFTLCFAQQILTFLGMTTA